MDTYTELTITEEQIKKYRGDGFFILEKVIPENELELIRKECVDLIEEQNKQMDLLGVNEIDLSRRNSRYFVFLAYKTKPHLGSFIFSSRMAEICKSTIGPNAYLFWEQFVVKGTDKKGSEFTWHQDSGYVDSIHKPYVNAWIPLDDVNEENGTVYLLPYSLAGTKKRIQHKPVPGTKDRVGYFGAEKGIPANCSAGSIVVFSSTCFHRSGLNNTDKMRRAYAIQFSPEIIYDSDGSLKGLEEKFLEEGIRVDKYR